MPTTAESVIFVDVPDCGPLKVHQSAPVWIGPTELAHRIADELCRSERLALHCAPPDDEAIREMDRRQDPRLGSARHKRAVEHLKEVITVMDADGFPPRKLDQMRTWIRDRLAGADLPPDAPRWERVAQMAYDA